MAGLDPAISGGLRDRRVKPGDDEKKISCPALAAPLATLMPAANSSQRSVTVIGRIGRFQTIRLMAAARGLR
ncbi:MAG TPA: hypothetical protein VFA12_06775 [Stellaceae bacterium]|nr:hypothetical protein [Stellaceae bacterium]